MSAIANGKTANWKLTLSYDGSAFHGWQIQSAQAGLRTIQGVLAESIARLTGEQVLPQGSGRTDAGVHALAQVASFHLRVPVPPANLQRALNRILPLQIRVLSAQIVPFSFHARHSARKKTYEYRIFERRIRQQPGNSAQPEPPAQPAEERICSPFLAPFVWDCCWPLSLDALQEAAAMLPGTHDFTSMAAADPDRTTRGNEEDDATNPGRLNSVKTIFSSQWCREDGLLKYRITGSGFLHHMVRNLVGTMVDIGRGSLDPADIGRILSARDRTQAGPTAPARGLYLIEVFYDEPSQPENSSDDHGESTTEASA